MRRSILLSVACAATFVLTACSGTAEPETASSETTSEDCAPATSTDLGTEEGWLGLIDQSPENVSLLIDDGRGRTVEHRAAEPQQLASAVKVVHLGAYARAVAAGELDPGEEIPLLDWERWYVPGTDGGAHPLALDRLGIANDGVSAADPAATVRLDDIVSAMIQESDNAAPDYLRYRVGADALVDAAAAGGWDEFEAPTLVTSSLTILDPALGDGDQWETANRWAFDQDFRVAVSAAAEFPSYEDQVARVESSANKASAAQLDSLYRAFADGSYGDGTDIVIRQLEYQGEGIGFKGGSLPGVLTQAFEMRRDDGTAATAVWLIDGLSADRFEAALAGLGVQQGLLLDAMDSDEALDRFACVV